MAIEGWPCRTGEISVVVVVRDAVAASEFYRKVFGATELYRHRTPEGDLLGIDLRVGETVFSVATANPRREADRTLGGPFSAESLGASCVIFNLVVDDVDAVFRRAIEAGGWARGASPVEDTYWGDRTACFTDPFGHVWALATPKETVPYDALERRRDELFARERSRRRAGAIA